MDMSKICEFVIPAVTQTARNTNEIFDSGEFNLQNEARERPVVKVDNDFLKGVVGVDTFQTTCELVARFEVTVAAVQI